MQRCNPAHKQEKPEKGVAEGNVMLAGREPAGGHGHSHAIPAAVPADSGFEVSTFDFKTSPAPQAALRGFLVVLAISLHAVFEGIAMGLTDNPK